MEKKKNLFESIADKLEQKKLEKQFDEVLEYMQTVFQYEKEIELIKPHKHFKVTEIENKVIELLEDNPKLFAYQNDGVKQNLGMFACWMGLDEIAKKYVLDESVCFQRDVKGGLITDYAIKNHRPEVLRVALDNKKLANTLDEHGKNLPMQICLESFEGREDLILKALDDFELSTHQDDGMANLGMHAAICRMEKAAAKAIKNSVAAKQVESSGRTIGMISAIFGLKEASLMALEDKNLAIMQDDFGQTIGHLAVKYAAACDYRFIDVVLKALDNPELARIQDKNGYNIGMQAAVTRDNGLEDIVLKALDDPIAAIQTSIAGYNMAWLAVQESDMERVAIKALDNPVLRTATDENGNNLGIMCAIWGLNQATLKALDYEDSKYQERIGVKENIAMMAADAGLEDVVIKALSDEKLSTMQDDSGCNLGMYAVANDLDNAALIALENPVASVQQDLKGNNIGMYAARRGKTKLVQVAKMNEVARNQTGLEGFNMEQLLENEINESTNTSISDAIVNLFDDSTM